MYESALARRTPKRSRYGTIKERVVGLLYQYGGINNVETKSEHIEETR